MFTILIHFDHLQLFKQRAFNQFNILNVMVKHLKYFKDKLMWHKLLIHFLRDVGCINYLFLQAFLTSSTFVQLKWYWLKDFPKWLRKVFYTGFCNSIYLLRKVSIAFQTSQPLLDYLILFIDILKQMKHKGILEIKK